MQSHTLSTDSPTHLLDLSLRAQLHLGQLGHGGCSPLEHAPHLGVQDHGPLGLMSRFHDLRVHQHQQGLGGRRLRPVHAHCPCEYTQTHTHFTSLTTCGQQVFSNIVESDG